jgi:hypothetical protein
MRPVQVTVGPLAAASANNICLSQSLGAAGNLTLNGALVSGGVATLDTPRRIQWASAGNDSGITATLYGTNFSGQTITETLSGTNASFVYTAQDFATVTRIRLSGATASTVTVGTNNVASSWPVFLDYHGHAETSLQVVVTGTVTFAVQQSLDNPRVVGGIAKMNWFNHPDPAMNGSASAQSNYAYLPFATKITLSAGTGSAVLTVIQAAAPQGG